MQKSKTNTKKSLSTALEILLGMTLLFTYIFVENPFTSVIINGLLVATLSLPVIFEKEDRRKSKILLTISFICLFFALLFTFIFDFEFQDKTLDLITLINMFCLVFGLYLWFKRINFW